MAVFVLEGTFQQILVQLAFAGYRIVVCARTGHASTFTGHHFNELCIYLTRLGIRTEHTDIFLREVGELHDLDAIGFRTQVSFYCSSYTASLCESVRLAN